MLRENIQDLFSFIVVARERSFTRAAAQLGMSQSGVSHAIRALEERLQVRLPTRTTRSVAPTAEGERLLAAIAPRLEEIEQEMAAVSDLSRKPAGTIRITAEDFAIDRILWPKLRKVLWQYPDIKVELVVDYGLTDIVAERFDAGVRVGEVLADGMIAVRISPNQRMIAIGSPGCTTASTCGFRRAGGSMPGSSRRTAKSLPCGSMGRWPSTASTRSSTLPWMATASASSPKADPDRDRAGR